jgi:hypothetical protein
MLSRKALRFNRKYAGPPYLYHYAHAGHHRFAGYRIIFSSSAYLIQTTQIELSAGAAGVMNFVTPQAALGSRFDFVTAACDVP